MPSFKVWNDLYHADGFWIIFNNDADTLEAAESYLVGTIGFTADDHVDYIGNTNPDIWGPYGLTGYPTTVLLDRDGKIRLQAVGAIDQDYAGYEIHTQFEKCIKELCGVS